MERGSIVARVCLELYEDRQVLTLMKGIKWLTPSLTPKGY
jgi:hypothetical protein